VRSCPASETAIGAHEGEIVPCLDQFGPQIGALDLIAGIEDAVGARGCDEPDFFGEAALFHLHLPAEHHIGAHRLQLLGDETSQVDTVGIIVEENSHPLHSQRVDQIVRGHTGLNAVVGVDAEKIAITAMREGDF